MIFSTINWFCKNLLWPSECFIFDLLTQYLLIVINLYKNVYQCVMINNNAIKNTMSYLICDRTH